MPRTNPQSVEFNTFVRGIITEAGPLTYPDNASLDESNFILNKDGSRQRRLGMDYEPNAILTDIGVDISTRNIAVRSFIWDNAGGSGVDIVIVQAGDFLYFFNAGVDTISASPLNGGTPLDISTVVDSDLSAISGTALYGRFIFSHKSQDIYILEYDASIDSVSSSTERLDVRDLWGIVDGYSLTERAATLTTEHYYNLRNQGWPREFTGVGQAVGSRNYPIFNTWTNSLFYPAHSDSVWAGKVEAASSPGDIGKYSSELLRRYTEGSLDPPKGSHIIDLFNRGASRRIKIDEDYWSDSTLGLLIDSSFSRWDIPDDTSTGYVTSVASYAGRIFYTVREETRVGADGFSPDLNSLVLFSQVGSSRERLNKCYSRNDITSENLNDPLSSDGGFISIPGAGQILGLVPLGDSLFVLATNGVWEIHGGDRTFSATNQNVSKVTSAGAISDSAVVSSESVASYWSEGGIYLLSIDPSTLRGNADNATKNTIQTLYEEIGDDAKRDATGVYDEVRQQIRWLYRSEDLPNSYLYDKELVLDLQLQAFSKSDIGQLDARSPYVSGAVDIRGLVNVLEIETVTVGGVPVTVGGEDVTVPTINALNRQGSSTKYLVFRQNAGDSNFSFTFAEYRDATFVDWISADGTGVDAPAFLLTGYLTGGDSQRNKASNYITVHLRRTESGFEDVGGGNLEPKTPSSCLVQSQWEWTNNAGAGKWSAPFQAYRLKRFYTPSGVGDTFEEYGYTTVTTKNRLRGRGRALSLRYDTEAGKDLHLYGWALNLTADGRV